MHDDTDDGASPFTPIVIDGHTGPVQGKAVYRAVRAMTGLPKETVAMVLDAYHALLIEQAVEYGCVTIPGCVHIFTRQGRFGADGSPRLHLDADVHRQIRGLWGWRIRNHGDANSVTRHNYKEMDAYRQTQLDDTSPITASWAGWPYVQRTKQDQEQTEAFYMQVGTS